MESATKKPPLVLKSNQRTRSMSLSRRRSAKAPVMECQASYWSGICEDEHASGRISDYICRASETNDADVAAFLNWLMEDTSVSSPNRTPQDVADDNDEWELVAAVPAPPPYSFLGKFIHKLKTWRSG